MEMNFGKKYMPTLAFGFGPIENVLSIPVPIIRGLTGRELANKSLRMMFFFVGLNGYGRLGDGIMDHSCGYMDAVLLFDIRG
jgi:hypothetical protein